MLHNSSLSHNSWLQVKIIPFITRNNDLFIRKINIKNSPCEGLVSSILAKLKEGKKLFYLEFSYIILSYVILSYFILYYLKLFYPNFLIFKKLFYYRLYKLLLIILKYSKLGHSKLLSIFLHYVFFTITL
jgi:hypothetical protein